MSLKIHTEVEVVIWQQHDVQIPELGGRFPVTSIDLGDIFPRYLGMGVISAQNVQFIWSVGSSFGDPSNISTEIFRVLPDAENRDGEDVSIFTAHLFTFSNLEDEDRPGYSNSLLSAPRITESLPSLTSPVTSLSSISVAIGDPDLRRLFEGSQTKTTTQNPIRVYRSVCERRSLIWSGYLDGISISQTHQTTLNCRPLLKKLDQLANFGFDSKLQKWSFNNFSMPIVACKLMPWTIAYSDHSAVGAEIYSCSTDTGYRRIKNRYYIKRGEGNPAWVNELFALPTANGLTSFIRPRNYTLNLSSAVREPYVTPTPLSGTIPDEERDTIPERERANELASEHLENYKRPRYVSFEKSVLTRSYMRVGPDEATTGPGGLIIEGSPLPKDWGMFFERGIFFAPTDSARSANKYFLPGPENFRESLIPEGARERCKTYTSAAHYEKFLLGNYNYPISGGNIAVTNLQRRHLSDGFNLLGGVEGSDSQTTPRYRSHSGYDLMSTFPSLNLGENYCNWTHIPVKPQRTFRWTGELDSGANLYPPPPLAALERPVIKWTETRTDVSPDSKGFYKWSFAASSDRPHPLDSFFRTTQIRGSDLDRIVALQNARPYRRWSFYTPHGVSFVVFGRKITKLTGDPEIGDFRNVFAPERLMIPEFYFFTQYTSFLTYTDSQATHAQVIRENHHKFYGADLSFHGADLGPPPGTGKSYQSWISVNSDPDPSKTVKVTFCENGLNEIPMARSKDMYATESSFQTDQTIKEHYLKTAILFSENRRFSTIAQVNPVWNSLSSSSLRVMPAHPDPTNYELRGLPPNSPLPGSQADDNDFPAITTEGDGGAFYVKARYAVPNEVGYWDTSPFLNPTVDKNSTSNFSAYYHQHQANGRGVSPYNFLYSIIKSIGLRPGWNLYDTDPQEMSKDNPMQFIGNTNQTYRSLLARTCPGLGKSLRWDPPTNTVRIIDWLTAHENYDRRREVRVIYDEDCLRFNGITSSSVSIPSSFTFENPDMLRGNNTLEGFDDQNKLLARYIRVTSDIFIQGKALTVQTATWHESAVRGLKIYDEISDILSTRVDVVSFTVSTEILLGLGPLGSLAVGDWVRLVTPAFSEGLADVFITETNAGELETTFRAYRFLGVGGKDLSYSVPYGAPPASVDRIPGDDTVPDDENDNGEANVHRIYY